MGIGLVGEEQTLMPVSWHLAALVFGRLRMPATHAGESTLSYCYHAMVSQVASTSLSLRHSACSRGLFNVVL